MQLELWTLHHSSSGCSAFSHLKNMLVGWLITAKLCGIGKIIKGELMNIGEYPLYAKRQMRGTKTGPLLHLELAVTELNGRLVCNVF